MMSKILLLEFMLCVGCLYKVSGASYSKVYVQGEQEVVPVSYVPYGAPEVPLRGSQIAEISAAPLESTVPVSSSPNFITPCGSPCIYTGSAISSTPQIISATPNFVTYKSNTPVVLANKEEPSGYEYSYVVYDEHTGDHKAQHESSDGRVVRGQYSLIQPDGFVREVHYTADDINGFNAIVKKFLPVNVEAKSQHIKKENPGPPCESLTWSSHDRDQEKTDHIETHTGDEYHETTTLAASNVNLGEQFSGENHELEPILQIFESNEENQIDITKEANGKPSEALTKASSETSEEKELSEESLRVHEHTDHQILPITEPYNGQDAETHGEHDIHDEISKTANLEALGDPSYHNIIKCVQKAINCKEQIPAPLTYVILNSPC